MDRNKSVVLLENQKKTASSRESMKSCEEIQADEALMNLCRKPIECPIQYCNQIVGMTSVVAHILSQHNRAMKVDIDEIAANRRSVISFHEDLLQYGGNTYLGCLAYAGREGGKENLPAAKKICFKNAFLPNSHSHLRDHLPIIVLSCKTSLFRIFPEYSKITDKDIDIIFIWLSTVELVKHVYCTITAFDNSLSTSRSTIVKVRRLKASQNPRNFFTTDDEPTFLMLNRGEMDILSHNGKSNILLEICIHEFD